VSKRFSTVYIKFPRQCSVIPFPLPITLNFHQELPINDFHCRPPGEVKEASNPQLLITSVKKELETGLEALQSDMDIVIEADVVLMKQSLEAQAREPSNFRKEMIDIR